MILTSGQSVLQVFTDSAADASPLPSDLQLIVTHRSQGDNHSLPTLYTVPLKTHDSFL